MELIKTINIYSEENYELFEGHPNNREIKESHVNNLAKNIKELGYNINFPILVKKINGKYRIYKGHHRFLACKKIGHPIIFAIDNNMTDLDLVNGDIVQKPINTKDAVEMYSGLGKEEYVKFTTLQRCYKLSTKETQVLMFGRHDGNTMDKIKLGKLTITDEMKKKFEIRAYNFNVLKDRKNLKISQITDWVKIIKVLDDYDLTEKFNEYLKRNVFTLMLNKKDFKEIKGKPYYEFIKDLVKDID